MRIPWWLALIGVVLAFAGGYAANTGGVDQATRDSLATFRSDNARLAQVNDSLAKDAAFSRELEVAANQRAESWRRKALAHVAAADTSGALADTAHAALARARSCADSVAALVVEAGNRQTECARLREANADLGHSLAEKDSVAGEKSRQLRDANGRVTNDSTQLARATGLIGKLERQVRGCRVPILGFPCPAGQASYDLTDQSFHVGAGIPVKRWLTVSLTTRLGGKP